MTTIDTRRAAYAAEIARWGNLLDPDQLEPEEVDQFLLIERNVDASTCATTHSTMGGAGEYHCNQEYPDDWAVQVLVNLDTGDRWEPRFRIDWVKAEHPAETTEEAPTDG